jgi:hypothetical protein
METNALVATNETGGGEARLLGKVMVFLAGQELFRHSFPEPHTWPD